MADDGTTADTAAGNGGATAEYDRKFAGVKKVGGLAGIVAADSAICTVGI